MLKLLKSFWRGFVGGPDFTRCISHAFILEDFILGNKQLTLELPNTNVAVVPSKIDISFPHTSTSWFKQHQKAYDQHTFVRIITKNWMYVPPIALFPSSEYGMLSCQLRIKQTDRINVLDKPALAKFVIRAYDDHHNSPNSKNTKIRKETTEHYNKRATEWSPEEIEDKIAERIEAYGKPPLPAALIKNINQTDWVFYQEVRNNRLSRHDYYCLPLSESSFLEVKFNHDVDRSDKHKKWAKHAMTSQERIMASISLHDLPIEHDSFIEHQAISK